MAEKDYFQEALSNFTHEVASGGAIRHLADLGYTVKQISEKLDFPTPYERIQRAVWERLLEVGVILTEEPGKRKPKEKVRYVREYDRFGKSSFRRVTEIDSGQAVEEIRWRERYVPAEEGERAAALLRESFSRNSAAAAYMSCDFGLIACRTPEVYAQMLQCLDRGSGSMWRVCLGKGGLSITGLMLVCGKFLSGCVKRDCIEGNVIFLKRRIK